MPWIEKVADKLPGWKEKLMNRVGWAVMVRFVLSAICWNLVHVAHSVNSKACTIIVPYCQDKERLSFLNMGVSYHSKIDACERKGDC
jgi:hypothetical protein